MSVKNPDECCPRFDPKPWNEQEIHWEKKLFLKDHVTSFFHIPLNFAGKMVKNMARIEANNAQPENMIVLSDENSLWGADLYIEVNKAIPGSEMAELSGTFLSKVYEGSFSQMKNWIDDAKAFAGKKGHRIRKLFFYYTTCPKCSKKYGENYVVILMQV